MWDSYPGGYQSYLNGITLATGGNDYGPQFGPAEPREYDDCPCANGQEDECSEHYDPGQEPLDDEDLVLVPEQLVAQKEQQG